VKRRRKTEGDKSSVWVALPPGRKELSRFKQRKTKRSEPTKFRRNRKDAVVDHRREGGESKQSAGEPVGRTKRATFVNLKKKGRGKGWDDRRKIEEGSHLLQRSSRLRHGKAPTSRSRSSAIEQGGGERGKVNRQKPEKPETKKKACVDMSKTPARLPPENRPKTRMRAKMHSCISCRGENKTSKKKKKNAKGLSKPPEKKGADGAKNTEGRTCTTEPGLGREKSRGKDENRKKDRQGKRKKTKLARTLRVV